MPHPRKIIAIVEDHDSVRKALDRLLSAAGYHCEIFASAEEFLAVARKLGASCLISDIQLYGMSGLHLALHPVVTELNLSTVLISGSTNGHMEAAAREIGAAFLRKPILSSDLLEAIIDIAGAPTTDDAH